ncbi:hypothetical protein CDL15_Pgr015299 [Punica granatum]|uniref:RING-type E3 ubiquitin transferase n=1 Tax=Punica granatum TaxID=22663 RepID=A0A218VZ78_PUNGR|nr:hypothetical protein CDL15_Pgr015299 [Punica granatum]PKI42359.1 hypothetical protein CRG98_037237 [Punica granatum]
MVWVLHESHPSPPQAQQPFFLFPPPPPPASGGFSLSNRVSPSILLIIIILAIIFFVSGLLHLLVRFLMRPLNREMDELESVTALQGQLQQLFHLHDAGVDQSFIDTLPVFYYKAIIGLKDPFDCAVCLCEFEAKDKLRLLPKCSHAFHMECIDTWLLSHSTCPLCRSNILPDFSPNSSCSPIVLVLESGSDSSREIVNDREAVGPPEAEPGSARMDKLVELGEKTEGPPPAEKVFSVKLGKFKNVDGGEGSSTAATTTTSTASVTTSTVASSNVDSRRCFSMGSFEYVMDETTVLQVPIRTPIKKQSSKSRKPAMPLKPGYRAAMSEYDCQSRRYFNGFEATKGNVQSKNPNSGNGVGSSSGSGGIVRKKDSFSISKIWLRGRGENKPSPSEDTSSRRAFSFRFPASQAGEPKDGGNKTGEANRISCEIEIGSEIDEETRSCNSMDYSQASSYRAPSFTRRTLLWLMGRQTQNRVGHSSSSSLDQV